MLHDAVCVIVVSPNTSISFSSLTRIAHTTKIKKNMCNENLSGGSLYIVLILSLSCSFSLGDILCVFFASFQTSLSFVQQSSDRIAANVKERYVVKKWLLLLRIKYLYNEFSYRVYRTCVFKSKQYVWFYMFSSRIQVRYVTLWVSQRARELFKNLLSLHLAHVYNIAYTMRFCFAASLPSRIQRISSSCSTER